MLATPEWGDPYLYPASDRAGFVSFHPPGSEGWPYPNLAYLRPWPPPGATTSTGRYNNAAWPLTHGEYGVTETPSSHHTPRSNQPVFDISGASRPGPIMGPNSWQQIPHNLLVPSVIDESGAGVVDIHPSLLVQGEESALEIADSHASCGNNNPRHLSQLTTVPPCKWMRLVHPHYPWKITVTAEFPSRGTLAGVTVRRVLAAIAEDLQKEVSQVEAHSVKGMQSALDRHQVSLAPDYYGGAVYAPLRRMHWLGTRAVRFLGLTADSVEPDIWIMHFGRDMLPEKPLPALPIPLDDPPGYPWHEARSPRICTLGEGTLRSVSCPPRASRKRPGRGDRRYEPPRYERHGRAWRDVSLCE